MSIMTVADIKIGKDCEVVFIAELGTCYECDLEVARELLTKAKNAGASLAKIECFRPEDAYRIKQMEGESYSFSTSKGTVSEDYLEHINRKSMTLDEYEAIFQFSNSINLPCFATVYDIDMMKRVKEFGAVAVKLSSCNIVHLPLIEYAGKAKLPLFLDTNNSLIYHIGRAVFTAKKSGIKNMVLMHNPIGPRPTPPEMHNFRVMKSYYDIFNVPVGFTCHYRGEEMMYAAIAMGAHAIEKPISRNPDTVDSEYAYSLNIKDLKSVVKKCKNVWYSMGKQLLEPDDIPIFVKERMSPCAKRKIYKGEGFSLDNVTFKRPCGSITPDYWDQIAGKKSRVDIEEDQLIEWGHLETNT
jgi:sialic acid synthase SpsE